MHFSDFKIRTRLALGFGLILVLMFFMAIFSALRLSAIADSSQNILEHTVPSLSAAQGIAATLQENGRRTAQLFVLTDASERKRQYDAIEANKKKVTEWLALLEKNATTDETRTRLKALTEARAAFVSGFGKTVELLEKGETDGATKAFTEVALPAQRQAIAAIETILEYRSRSMDADGRTITAQIVSAQAWLVGLSLLAIAIGIGLALLITRSITQPIEEAVNAARRISDGDLSGKIEVRSKDETGQLLAALADMTNSLVMTIGQVHASTEAINTASGEIASGNADLSSRTESQASSLEETASSMEELTSTVRQNADNARQANQLAISASDIAGTGGQVVGEVVNTMGSIRASSGKIVEIISVIDGIAFQTNILALNAAVEAARAGEQGRGFAVVASEVRNLAQRSATAAKEIKTLIDDSVGQVEQGSRLVDEAGQTMEKIVSAIRHVADIMGEITAASQEQSAGIEQVNLAVSHMDEMTQQNAALVEEAAAAAESMQEQAELLSRAVSVFRLQAHSTPNRAQPTAPSAAPARAPGKKPVVQLAAARKKVTQTKQLEAPTERQSAAKATRTANDDAGDWEEF